LDVRDIIFNSLHLFLYFYGGIASFFLPVLTLRSVTATAWTQLEAPKAAEAENGTKDGPERAIGPRAPSEARGGSRAGGSEQGGRDVSQEELIDCNEFTNYLCRIL
jgi:hypothetical protein